MNTKKYRRLFDMLLEKGDLPQDVYDIVTNAIAEDGKMTRRVYDLYLTELEKRRLFFTDAAPFDPEGSAKTDGNYKYATKNPFKLIAHAFWYGSLKCAGYFGGAIVFGIWRVKDRKKLKGLGACITTSNHVGYLDAVLTMRAMGFKRQTIVVAPHNCKNDVGGRILKSAGVVPLPTTLAGARLFEAELERRKKRKTKIHIYPEQSMWIGYRKPRQYKEGAFFYAEKLDLPVVPMLYCFKPPRGLRKLLHLQKAVIKISDPLYVDKELPPRQRRKDICDRAFAAAQKMYEDFYGVPLEYESADEKPIDTTNSTEER